MAENDFDIRLDRAGIPADRAAVVLRTILLLAEGQPVSRRQVGVADPEVWEELKRLGAEVDAENNIVALGGLSTRPTKHQFVIGNRRLFSWCALDTLFLPNLLGVPADVTSTCPVTGLPIHLRVSPQGIDSVDPEGTVVSLVRAESRGPADDRSELFGVQGSFCSRVHFFASSEAADAWLVTQQGAVIVSPEEAFRIGKKTCSLPLLGGGSCGLLGNGVWFRGTERLDPQGSPNKGG